ncbi:MFS transporter [Longispora sp. K20-0274]|uniref:MFS transporter n=1 Tax=Longispora sp. K20-0274 TaxID=3088255 RepID=UPI00399B6878
MITHRGPALAALATAQFLVVLSVSSVNVALPDLRAGLGLDGTALSWVVTAYVLGFGAPLLAAGRLADLYGRRRLFALGLAGFAVASLAAGIADGPAQLLVARAAQGLGAALLAPAALALALGLFPPGGGGRALGVWGAASGAGGAAGVLLGGLLTGPFGWPSIFLVTAGLAVPPLVAALRLLPADRPAANECVAGRRSGDQRAHGLSGDQRVPDRSGVDRPVPDRPADCPPEPDHSAAGRRGLDVPGAVAVTVGLVAVTYALSAGGTRGWGSPAVLGPAALGLAALAWFVRRQRRGAAPLVPPRLLRTGMTAPANVAMTLLGAVWVGLFYYLPLYQQQVLGQTPLTAALGQLPLAGMIVAGSTLAPRLPTRAAVTGALAAIALGLAWLSRAPVAGTYAADLLGPTLLLGAGIGVAFTGLTGLATRDASRSNAATAGGLVNTTRQVGGALGLALMTTVAQARTAGLPDGAPTLAAGHSAAFLTGAVLASVATLIIATRSHS